MASHHPQATHLLRDSIHRRLRTKLPQVVMASLRAAATPVNNIRINNLNTSSKGKGEIRAKGTINSPDGNSWTGRIYLTE